MGGDLGQYQCGSVGAVAALAALAVAERSGRGVWIDLANTETQVGSIDRRMTYLLYGAYRGEDVPRFGGYTLSPLPGGVRPTGDGYVQVSTIPGWIPRAMAVLDDADLTERYRSPTWVLDPDLPELADAALLGWTVTRPKQEAMEEAQAGRLAGHGRQPTGRRAGRPPFRRAGVLRARRAPGGRHRHPARRPRAPGRRLAAATAGPDAGPAHGRGAGRGRRHWATTGRPLRRRRRPTSPACPSRVCGSSTSPWCGPAPTSPPSWPTSAPTSSGSTTPGCSPPPPGACCPARPRRWSRTSAASSAASPTPIPAPGPGTAWPSSTPTPGASGRSPWTCASRWAGRRSCAWSSRPT